MDWRTYGLSWMDFKRIAHKKNFVITLQRYVHEFMSNFHIRIPFRESVHTTDSLWLTKNRHIPSELGEMIFVLFFCPVVWAQWSTFFVFHVILIYAEIMIRFWKEWWTIFMYGFYTFYSLSFFLSWVIKFKAIVFKLNISLKLLRVGFKGL